MFYWQAALSSQGTHISERVGENWEKQPCQRDEPGSLGAVVEKTMFAVRYYGQCPPPSRWQNVNAMEHFQLAALSTEACQEALQESVWLPSTTMPPPSTASGTSPPFPFIYLPAVCHLLISPVGSNVISSLLFHTHTHTHTSGSTMLLHPRTRALSSSVGLSDALVLVCPSFITVCYLMQSPLWATK